MKQKKTDDENPAVRTPTDIRLKLSGSQDKTQAVITPQKTSNESFTLSPDFKVPSKYSILLFMFVFLTPSYI